MLQGPELMINPQTPQTSANPPDPLRQRVASLQLPDDTDLLKLVVDCLSDGVAVADRDGNLLLFNPAAEQIVGMTVPVPAEQWSDEYGLFLPDGKTRFPTDQLPLLRATRGESVDDCLVLVRNERRPEGVWLSVNARPLVDRNGAPRGGVAVFRDITEKKRAQEALASQQKFLEQLLESHERDRQLMAYEIHDGLVQDITGALMHLESIMPPETRGRSQTSFEVALQLLREALDEGRRVISGLRPPILDEMGIVAAIDYLVGEHATQGVSAIRFNHDVLFDHLEPLLEGTLFRITQEALTNIKKHSKARAASVDLKQAGEKVKLVIRDDGVGFDPDQVEKGRFGIRGIRERAKLLHGQALIESKPGRGTRIYVELPLALPLHLMQKRLNE
jgi:signal transduction histidine kinase